MLGYQDVQIFHSAIITTLQRAVLNYTRNNGFVHVELCLHLDTSVSKPTHVK